MVAGVHLWSAHKDGTSVRAIARELTVGFELRIEFEGGMMFSQMFSTRDDMHSAAHQRLNELQGKGWTQT